MTGIYIIKNIINNKVYIGQSTDMKDRLCHHKSHLKYGRHSNILLQEDWDKYGSNSFVFSVLCECDKSELDEQECYYIEYYDSANPEHGYNKEGGGKQHKIIGEDLRKIRSDLMKGKYVGENNPMYGVHYKHTEEWKKNMSERNSGEGNPMYGVHLKISDERKQAQSERMQGEKNPFYGRKHNEETRQKMRENNKLKKAVLCVEENTTFPSAKEAWRQTGVYFGSICKCCVGKQHTAGGYHWEYIA